MTTSTDLVPAGALHLDPTQGEWTPQQLSALTQLGLVGVPRGDLLVFLHVAQRSCLDPFARQIYLIGRNDSELGGKRYTIQTGIDGFRLIAERTGLYGGQFEPEWCGEDGIWRDVWLERRPPVAARVMVIRKGWERPAVGIAHLEEFAAYKYNGEPTRMWREKVRHMLAKCAEALALRKAFPQHLSGIYTPEEMAMADAEAEQADRVNKPAPRPSQNRADAERIDWDAELTKRAGDHDKLVELYNMAREADPNNGALAERIAAAGHTAPAAAKQEPTDPSPDAETSDEIEAEIVDDEPQEPAAPEKPVKPSNQKQHGAITKLLGQHGATRREDRKAVVNYLVGAPVEAMADLTYEQAASLLMRIPELAEGGRFAATIDEALKATLAPAVGR